MEKTLESPLDCKEIQPVHPKGDQSWVFIGRTDAEAETPILWPPGGKSWLISKDSDAGKDWGQKEKEMTEDEMVGWHHRLNRHGFGWTLGQGGLWCCGSGGYKESDTTEWLNWNELRILSHPFQPLCPVCVFLTPSVLIRTLGTVSNRWRGGQHHCLVPDLQVSAVHKSRHLWRSLRWSWCCRYGCFVDRLFRISPFIQIC